LASHFVASNAMTEASKIRAPKRFDSVPSISQEAAQLSNLPPNASKAVDSNVNGRHDGMLVDVFMMMSDRRSQVMDAMWH
jgi:hypothetical protein